MPPDEPHTNGGNSTNEAAVAVAATTAHPNPRPLPFATAAVYPVTIKFEEVVYKVKLGQGGRWWSGDRRTTEKTILNGISGVVAPGEMLAMLGPSGSGKTTLLTALGGRLPGAPSGKITYNGHPFTGAMRRRTGFVPQDDVLYPHLTVAETLTFAALLRLPAALSRTDKAAHARNVAFELGLGRVADSLVGGARVRGISGGERKRVSIGLEMVVSPSLVLLDEPTSGLDSTAAQRIVGMLKRLAADGGRTVVTTIHQPSSRIYHMFDKVVLLSDGSPIYYGRGSAALEYFSSVGISTPSITVNPADLLLDLANGIEPDSKHRNIEDDTMVEQKAVQDRLISAYDRNIATRLKAELCDASVNKYSYARDFPVGSLPKKEQWSTSWWEQFTVLLERGLKERRHEAFNKLRIFQVLSVATLGGLLWWHTSPSNIQDRTALVFFFSVFWGFYPLYNAVFTFPQERPMLVKERLSGMYRLSSYFMARMAGDLPMELALPTAFVFILYWMGGLDAHPAPFLLSLLIVLLSVLVAQSLGLAVGALLMDVKQATTLASVTTLVFLIAGGYYVQHIPRFIVWLKYLSYTFYCYKLLLGVQFHANETYPCFTTGGAAGSCLVVDFPAIKAVGLDNMWVDVGIMGLMLIGYRFVAYLALRQLRPK